MNARSDKYREEGMDKESIQLLCLENVCFMTLRVEAEASFDDMVSGFQLIADKVAPRKHQLGIEETRSMRSYMFKHRDRTLPTKGMKRAGTERAKRNQRRWVQKQTTRDRCILKTCNSLLGGSEG